MANEGNDDYQPDPKKIEEFERESRKEKWRKTVRDAKHRQEQEQQQHEQEASVTDIGNGKGNGKGKGNSKSKNGTNKEKQKEKPHFDAYKYSNNGNGFTTRLKNKGLQGAFCCLRILRSHGFKLKQTLIVPDDGNTLR
jgi:hypothetical protein